MKRAVTIALVLVAVTLTGGCNDRKRSQRGDRSSGGLPSPTGGATTTGGSAVPARLARVADHGDPTGEEQELIELMQRARKDPVAEAQRINARHGTQLDFSSYPPRPPLSPNQFLREAATAHAQDMANRGFYGHTNPDGVGANGRILATKYDLHAFFGTSTSANYTENIGKGTGQGNGLSTPQGVHDMFLIDAGVVGAKHREMILGGGQFSRYREVGPSFLHVGTSDYVVEEFAFTKTDRPFVLGVAYDDRDGDGVCRAGEGTPNVPVTLSHASGFSVSTTTRAAGGFSFEVFVDGDYTLRIGAVSSNVSVRGLSVKVDAKSGQVAR